MPDTTTTPNTETVPPEGEAETKTLLGGGDQTSSADSAPAKTETTTQGGKEDKAKEGESEPKESQVPENYEIKAPEGMEIDAQALEEFTPLAKELGLTNEQAQKLADLHAARQTAVLEKQREDYLAQVESWVKEVKADKEIGGANLQATQAACKKALSAYDPDKAFTKLMDASGFGNHPAVLRFVARVGKSVAEDSGAQGSAAPKPRDLNAIFYGNSAQKSKEN